MLCSDPILPLMSFHSLKETLLRPCSTSTSTSTSTSSSLSESQPPSPPRRPPKTSLAHQLLRLDPIPSLLLRKEPTLDESARDSPLEPPVPSQFPPRKPPKSSLSQQLQRLDLPDFSPSLPIPKRNTDKAGEDGKDGEEEEDSEEEREEVADVRVNWRLPVAHSGIETRGPYEPLVLSAPGEGPLVQVMVL